MGSRKSGKTTTVEALVRGLTERGYRVGTAKHIPEHDFTIDTEGKDTWRHARSGACTILCLSAKELVVIKKLDTTKYNLNDITGNFGDTIDVAVLEGFRNLVAQDRFVPKVVTIRNQEELSEARRFFKPILAFTGSSASVREEYLGIPLIDVTKRPERLVNMVDRRVGPMVRKRRDLKQELQIEINGKYLPLKPFVQRIMKNTMLSMISSLKGARLKGNQRILIEITAAND